MVFVGQRPGVLQGKGGGVEEHTYKKKRPGEVEEEEGEKERERRLYIYTVFIICKFYVDGRGFARGYNKFLLCGNVPTDGSQARRPFPHPLEI